VIARDTESVRRRERGRIALPIGKEVLRPRQRGLEQSFIAHAAHAAMLFELAIMDGEDEVFGEPARLGHCASAFNTRRRLRMISSASRIKWAVSASAAVTTTPSPASTT